MSQIAKYNGVRISKNNAQIKDILESILNNIEKSKNRIIQIVENSTLLKYIITQRNISHKYLIKLSQ